MTIGEGLVVATAIYVGAGFVSMAIVLFGGLYLMRRVRARHEAAMADLRQGRRGRFTPRHRPPTPPPPKKGD